MTDKIINGRILADRIIDQAAQRLRHSGQNAGLAAIMVGNNPASALYVSLKKKACEKVGITFSLYTLDRTTTTEAVLEIIDFLNTDPEMDGILVQLPLPDHLDATRIIAAIDPKKDVDGFHPVNRQALREGNSQAPGLAEGIFLLLKSTGEALAGRQACVLANSDEFADANEAYLKKQGLTANHAHITDEDWSVKTKSADVLIVAVGSPLLIKKENIKRDAIIIDVGTNKMGDKTVGDVDFNDVYDKCSHITPVPGGVGPVTIAMLIQNCLRLARIDY
ncbi:MAG: bifunctional methylenetetrahydrofolate dehydrogenase/methenyltetrahydrofolate cyclohydrolase [Candidatus Komeilibacteria bacterium]|nr:bifunctional methylenetetrahydrofolate dehydrogenase/methenyltetrahydrofolate cyclohydrolase [Candidatus Komeilibacteria bacterium]